MLKAQVGAFWPDHPPFSEAFGPFSQLRVTGGA